MVVTSDERDRRAHAAAALARDDDADLAATYRPRELLRRRRRRLQLPTRRASLGARDRSARPTARGQRGSAGTRSAIPELLDGVAGVSFPFDDSSIDDSSHHLAVALLPEGVSRDAVRAHLQASGSKPASTIPRSTVSRSTRKPRRATALPRTDEIADRILTLPLFPHMQDDDVTLVADALERAVRAEHSHVDVENQAV